jgi:hypothetical protein
MNDKRQLRPYSSYPLRENEVTTVFTMSPKVV